MNAVIKRNTLKGLMSTVMIALHKADVKQKNSKSYYYNYLFYSLIIIFVIMIIGLVTMHSNSQISAFICFILFPAYAFLQISIILFSGKSYRKYLLRIITTNNDSLDIKLDTIYRECIAESYLTGTMDDIRLIDEYIEGLQELTRFSNGYSLKFIKITDLFKVMFFCTVGLGISLCCEAHKLEILSHIKSALSVLFLLLICSLIILETITYTLYYFSERKRVNNACKLLVQIRYIVMDSGIGKSSTKNMIKEYRYLNRMTD